MKNNVERINRSASRMEKGRNKFKGVNSREREARVRKIWIIVIMTIVQIILCSTVIAVVSPN